MRDRLRGFTVQCYIAHGESVQPVKLYDQGIELSDRGVRRDDVVAVARHGASVAVGVAARDAMLRTSAVIDGFVHDDVAVYGVTTGFGSLASVVIPPDRTAELQLALLRSHAAGMGPEVEAEIVRALMFLRARSLCLGYSGVRPQLADGLAGLLNAGITPVVHEYGSLGASGDLAPLAHVAMVLVGEGVARTASGQLVSGRAALAAAGLAPLVLREKEGLALINGTDGMLGMLCMAIDDLTALLQIADIAAAMSVEGLLGTDRAYAADLQALRPQIGQAVSAANLRRLLAGSPIVASHRHGDGRVQDAYSLRCTPQVHGAARDTVTHAQAIADRELVAAIDNPMILPDGRVESCGNFHGAPIGYVLDFLAIAVADIGALAERRTDRMLDVARSWGLPPFLSPDAGVNSGMMIAHYTQAAMVSENRRLAVPASVDTMATSAMQEDHVSMGWNAARKLRAAVDNLARIFAVELTCAARAIELRAPLEPGPGTAAALAAIRGEVEGAGPDRWLSPELAIVERLVKDRTLLDAVTAAIGELE
jgi:histidine ammonia-lyase